MAENERPLKKKSPKTIAARISLDVVYGNSLSGVTKTSSTTLPPEALQKRPEKQIDLATEHLLNQVSDLALLGKDPIKKIVREVLHEKKEDAIIHIGDKYVFISPNITEAQIGGRGHSIDMQCQQHWNNLKDIIDISALHNQLNILIDKLQKTATTEEELNNLAKLATARQELKKANGPGMIKYLRRTGRWVFETATNLGLNVVAQILSQRITQ
jgi:hypothetical protein